VAYGILKDNRRVTQTLENNMFTETLGGNDFLTFRSIGRSALHITVNV
jgi:hypothetical protein